VEKVVIRLLEQLATTQQMAQPATRSPARNASAVSRRQLTSHVLETRNY